MVKGKVGGKAWASDQETLLYLLKILNSPLASARQKSDAAIIKRVVTKRIRAGKKEKALDE